MATSKWHGDISTYDPTSSVFPCLLCSHGKVQSKRGLGMDAGAASGSNGSGEKRQRTAFGQLDLNHRPQGPSQAPSRYMSEGMRAQVVGQVGSGGAGSGRRGSTDVLNG